MTHPETSLPADTAVGRVALRVGDLDRLAEFYTSVVGLNVLARDDDHATLGVGETPLVELVHAPDTRPRANDETGLFHTAFRVPDRTALGSALDRIEESWRLTGASDHRVSEALYLQDPENNGVEIYRDRPRAEWPTADGRVQMDTLPLDLDSLRTESDGRDSFTNDTDVGHVHLEVSDIERAQKFYVETLGFDIRQEWDGALFVAAGGYHHHVGLNAWNGRTEPATGRGLDWFELVVTGDALTSLRERLTDAGVAIEETDGGIEVSDPDGIGLRLVSR